MRVNKISEKLSTELIKHLRLNTVNKRALLGKLFQKECLCGFCEYLLHKNKYIFEKSFFTCTPRFRLK